MGDFYQTGIVTTLHNLTQRPTDALESELLAFSKHKRLGLILPCLYSELETEAMPNIVRELSRVPYLSQLVIGLDCANEEEYRKALVVFNQLPHQTKVLWNDGPRLRAIDQKLRDAKLSQIRWGRGGMFGFAWGTRLVQTRQTPLRFTIVTLSPMIPGYLHACYTQSPIHNLIMSFARDTMPVFPMEK